MQNVEHEWVQGINQDFEPMDSYLYTNSVFCVKKLDSGEWGVIDLFPDPRKLLKTFFVSKSLNKAKAWVERKMANNTLSDTGARRSGSAPL